MDTSKCTNAGISQRQDTCHRCFNEQKPCFKAPGRVYSQEELEGMNYDQLQGAAKDMEKALSVTVKKNVKKAELLSALVVLIA